MRFWLWIAAAFVVGGFLGMVLFAPYAITVSVVPDFTKSGRVPRVATAHFKPVAQDLTSADEMHPGMDGTIRIDDRATVLATCQDVETTQRRIDALVGERCNNLLRTVATSCRLEHLSVEASGAPQAACPRNDKRAIDVFMRFAVLPKASR